MDNETQATIAAEGSPTEVVQPGCASTLPMMVLIFGIFYFLMIRPQQKEQLAHRKLVSNLQRGDKVVTGSGVHGEVFEVRDDVVVMKIADKVRITVEKMSVKRKLEPKTK